MIFTNNEQERKDKQIIYSKTRQQQKEKNIYKSIKQRRKGGNIVEMKRVITIK